MRVIAGELGGRRLHAPPGDEIRPTSDRVREALFSILGDVGDAVVLDLYCGTGALGIEALSRGAARAVLVDTAIDAAASNVAEFGLGERVELERTDALRFLGRDTGTYDLVLCDPPYSLARRLGPELDTSLPPRLAVGARVIVETSTKEPLELSLPLLDERSYGSTRIRIHAAPGDRR